MDDNNFNIEEYIASQIKSTKYSTPRKLLKDGKGNHSKASFDFSTCINNANHPNKNFLDLESKFKSLEKTNKKLSEKLSDIYDDYKKNKSQLDTALNNIDFSKKAVEKLNFENSKLQNQLNDNKAYIRKLESRLAQTAKQQYLIDLNNKLRDNCDELKIEIEGNRIEKESLKEEIEKKNGEIRVLNKALELRAEDFKGKGDIRSALLYDVGQCKQETDECKEKNKSLKHENELLSAKLDVTLCKLEKLNFSKVEYTELIVALENKSKNTEAERNFFEENCQVLTEEKKELIDKMSEMKESFEQDLKQAKIESHNLSCEIVNLESKLENLNDENYRLTVRVEEQEASLNAKGLEVTSLINELEGIRAAVIELEEANNTKETRIKELSDTLSEYEKQGTEIKEENKYLGEMVLKLKDDNNEYIKSNKRLVLEKDKIQTEVNKLNHTAIKIQIRIAESMKIFNDYQNPLVLENEQMKCLENEIIEKHLKVLNEKEELEKDVLDKDIRIESLISQVNHLNLEIQNLKTKNKTKKAQPKKNHHPSELTDEEKIIKVGASKLEENSILKLIQVEQLKNKAIKEGISKLRSNIYK